jgi:hypothetical protein
LAAIQATDSAEDGDTDGTEFQFVYDRADDEILFTGR